MNPAREGHYDETIEPGADPNVEGFQLAGLRSLFVALIGLILALILWRASGSLLLGAALFAVGIAVSVAVQRRFG